MKTILKSSLGLNLAAVLLATCTSAWSQALPAPWTSQDVGGATPAGDTVSADGTNFTVRGGGYWYHTNPGESFHFVCRPMTGDGTITARLSSLSGGLAGVMMRETLVGSGRFAMTTVQPGYGVFPFWRFVPEAVSGYDSGYAYTLPTWIKLVRQTNLFSYYHSGNGLDWTLIASTTIPMTNLIYVGLIACDYGSGSGLATATFSNVEVQSGPAPFIVRSSSDQIAWVGGTVPFNVLAAGEMPLAYRWYKDGAALTNNAFLSGATNDALTLSNAQTSDSGNYWTVVTNSFGSATSAVARLTVIPLGSCVPVPAGLVGWWPGEGNADDLIGTANGTNQGGIFYTNAGVGRGFTFNSDDDRAVIPHRPSFNPANPGFTVQFWMKGNKNQPGASCTLVEKSHGFADYSGWAVQLTTSSGMIGVNFGVGDNAWPGGSSTRDVLNNQWHHIAATWNGSAIGFYVDGVLESTGTMTTPVGNTRPLNFGFTWGGGNPQRFFRGQLDEVTIHSRALSSNEIVAVYAAGSAGMCKSLAIVEQPQDTTSYAGLSATFGVRAMGNPPLSYQWFKQATPPIPLTNSPAISGAATNVLTFTSVENSDAGDYFVAVTDASGTITSAPARLTVLPMPSCVATPAGLIGWWPGDGDAYDRSGTNFGTLQNGATYAAGFVGRALSFNGGMEGVTLSPNALNRAYASMTVEAWVYPTQHGHHSTGLYGYTILSTTEGDGFALRVFDGYLQPDLRLTSGTVRLSFTQAMLPLNAWSHVAFTYDGSQVRAYLNGQLLGSQAASGRVRNSANNGVITTIGNEGNASGIETSDYGWRGRIDELAVFERGLTPNEIAAIHAAGPAGMCKSLTIVEQPQPASSYVGADANFNVRVTGNLPLAYQWFKQTVPPTRLVDGPAIGGAATETLTLADLRLNDAGDYFVVITNTSGSVTSSVARLTVAETALSSGLVAYFPFSGDARDATGHGNDGTVQGAELTLGHNGRSDSAYSFDGTGDYINCGTGPSMNLNYLTNMTVAAWVRLDNVAAGYRPILSKHTQDGTPNGRAEFLLQVQNNGNLQCFLGDSSNGWYPAPNLSGGILAAQRWYHVAMTVTNTQVALYLDGRVAASGTYAPSQRPFGLLPLQIGRFNNGDQQFFQGTIDEVRVYGRALSPVEVLALMNAEEGIVAGQAPDWLWGRQSVSQGELTQPLAVTSDAAGNAYVTGTFQGVADFGTNRLIAGAWSDMFVAKHGTDGAPLWAHQGGATYTSYTNIIMNRGFGVVVDARTNTYVAGSFAGTNFPFGVYAIVSAGNADMFLAKYDHTGMLNHGAWSRRAGGPDWESAQALAIDRDGNLYVTGQFVSPRADFGTNFITNHVAGTDIFVAKYATNGDCVWAKAAGGADHDMGYALAVDDAGNVYVTGYFEGTALFDSRQVIAAGGRDVFIAKYDAVGHCDWVRSAGGTTHESANALTLLAGDRLCIAGYFQGTATFGATVLPSPGANRTDWFVAEYDTQGNSRWAKHAGGTNAWCRALATDAAGHLYAAGMLGGTGQFGGQPLASSGPLDLVIAMYDVSGNVLWNRVGGNTYAEALGLACDPAGNLIVAGVFEGNARFGPDALTNPTGRDMFVAKLGISAPSLLTQPQSVTTNVGANVSFAVQAGGSGPLFYEWSKGGVPIGGATNATLVLTNVQLTNAGLYRVTVSNLWGTDSASAQLTVDLLPISPSITVQPQPVTTNVGATVVFRVTATGTPPLYYQWLKDNAPLANSGNVSGATSTNLVLANLQLADSGHAYSVIVSNVVNTVTSAPPVVLTVNAAGGKPVILSQTLAVTTNVGATVVLEVTAEGAAPLMYQWFNGNRALPTRTNRTCVLSPSLAADQGSYVVVVRNSQGPTRSAAIPVTLTPSSEPRWQWVETGGGPGDDEALDLWAARAGHQLWVAGYVQSGAEMTGGEGRMASFGGSDTLLMRLNWDEGGMHFNTFSGGGADDDRAVAFSRDATNLFWAGIFKSALFAPGDQTLTNQGGWDFFANAIGPNQQQWTLDVGASGDEMCSGLAGDQRGGVVVSGNLNEPAGAIFSWGGSGFLITNRGSWDVVAQKASAADGAVNWLRLDGGSGGDISFGLAVDPQGNAFLAGYTDSTNATFGAFALQNHGSGDGFVAKYRAADGVVEWARSLGGLGSEAAYSVTTDSAGDAYVAGAFTSTNFTLGSIPLVNRGARNLFVAKLRGSDGAVLWARSFGGSGADIPSASALSVVFGAAGQLFIAGTIASPDTHFGSLTLNSANGDLFLAELNRTSGEPQWVTQASGQFNSLKIQADDFGNVYLAGSYRTSATFGPFVRENRGGKDLFVACYGFSPPTLWEQPQLVITNVGAIARLSVRATSTLPMTYQWRANGVAIPGATNSTLVFASARTNDTGLYAVVVSNPSGSTLSSNAPVYVVADGISELRASQRPDTNVVKITYDLGGATSCAVSLSASADGGATWNSPIASVSGDVGEAVRPGARRQIQWDIGRDWPGQEVSNVVVRTSACGAQATTVPFAVNTRTVPSWKLRVWIDFDRDGNQDDGEQLNGAEIYYGGRTPAYRVDFVVDGDSLRVSQPLRFGAPLFVRIRAGKAAVKPSHEAVEKKMFWVWYDSDLGPEDGDPGTGDWQSYLVTSADIGRAAAGSPIEIQLRHCTIAWNLVVASEISSPDFLAKFKTGLESASRILYDATDGQMKLGEVAIYPGVTQTSTIWRNADVVIYSRIEDQSLYQNGAIFWAMPGGVFRTRPEDQLYLGAHARGQPPDSLKYDFGFVHEFGHYALQFLDEYLDGRNNQAAWQLYREQHPNLAPRDFGLMDAAGAYTPEISSFNDYLFTYTGPIASNDVAGRSAVSSQLYGSWLSESNRWAPCWQYLEYSFEYIGGGISIVVPPRGYYLGQQRRSQSARQGPYTIPAPYLPIEFPNVQSGLLMAAKSAEIPDNRVSESPVQIRATWQGTPVAGAQVVRFPAAENRLVALGTTDRAGQLSVYDLVPGDVLVTRWRGAEKRLTMPSPLDRSGPIAIELAREQTGGVHAAGDGPDPFGVIVLPSVSGATNRLLSLTVRTEVPLSAPPSVVVHPNDATGLVPIMGASAPNTYTGTVAVAEATGGTVELSCEPASGERLAATDLFTITTVAATNAVMLRARDGWAEFNLDPGAVTTDQPGLVYSSYAPVLYVPGPTKRQVGPVLTAALGSGPMLNGTHATVNFFYRDSALAGLDETTLALYRWNNASSQWQAIPFDLAISQDVLSASLSELGTFALFAEPSADTTPPGAINDLQASSGTNGWSVRLHWTAPGDDGQVGTAATYVLRFSTAEITASNVDQAVIVPIALTPHIAGTAENFDVTMPAPGASYFFALQALDEAGNLGPLSTGAAARSCQDDSDGDGMSDQWEATYQFNPFDPSDADSDADGDGMTNGQEHELGTNPRSWDTDGDGMSDAWETQHNLNVRSAADRDGDADGDGLTNIQEHQAGTDPSHPDTDGDGLPDQWEVANGLASFSASGDSGADGDPDHDGRTNRQEYEQNGNPLAADGVRIASGRLRDEGGFELAVMGQLGQSYTLKASTNLVDWTTVCEFVCTNTATIVTDTNAANFSRRFYRVTSSSSSSSALRLTAIEPVYTASQLNAVRLTWLSTAGRLYEVQRTSDLAQGFTPVASGIAATPPNNVFTDGSVTNASSLFYRVKESMP